MPNKTTNTAVACPNCGTQINVNEMLYHQVGDELEKKYADQLQQEKQKLAQTEAKIAAEQADLARKKAAQQATIDKAVNDGVNAEKVKLQQQIKEQLAAEQGVQIEALQKELNDKSQQVKSLNQTRAEVEKLKREKEELRDKIQFESQQQLTQQLAQERDKIQQAEQEKAKMNLLEKDTLIQQLNTQLKDAQRKVEQGSMQMQGEVQELAIESWLADHFPFDEIVEVRKGERGADCLQVVNTASQSSVGSIYYESKRTKHFQPAWIEKFKQDIREKGADIGVLVTSAMPKDMDRMGLYEGVWVCSFDEFKGLCTVLRESLIRLSTAVSAQDNKGDKMSLLYGYLTGSEFSMQVEAIVEGFTQMKTELDAEKRAMNAIWKKRDKQIEKVLLNTTQMYGSIKGIAGNAVQPVAALELESTAGLAQLAEVGEDHTIVDDAEQQADNVDSAAKTSPSSPPTKPTQQAKPTKHAKPSKATKTLHSSEGTTSEVTGQSQLQLGAHEPDQ